MKRQTNRAWRSFLMVSAGLLVALSSPKTVLASQCPLQMPQDAIKTGVTPAGWESKTLSGARLTMAGLLLGPYESSGYLRPGTTRVKKSGPAQRYTETWSFEPLALLPKWLYCGYGSALELYKRLPDDLDSCTMVSTVLPDHTITSVTLNCIRGSP